jgi:stage II sporulation protein D
LKYVVLAALLAAAVSSAQVTYKVRLTGPDGGGIVELPAEKYVAAVLAGESSTFQSEEALKAMAVAARTYAARLRGRHASEGYDFCSTTHCQRVDLHAGDPRLEHAAQATAGELLWFEGKTAFTVYSRDCGGETEDVRHIWPDVQASYLAARADPFCTRHGASAWSWAARPEEIVQALRASWLSAPAGLRQIVVRPWPGSERARTLELLGRDQQIGISAGPFRFAIGRNLGWNTLRSDRYKVESRGSEIVFHGLGEGHGAGLCQNGADEMGREGYSYRAILAFYYPGTVVSRTGAGLKWVQMAGEGVTVLSTRPERDRAVLSEAEAMNRGVAARLHAKAAAGITIRVYPDVETFRNATGEPGWVAARTSELVIDLQPVAVLESRGILGSTLRHELLHAAVERQAAPDLPVWFREGLVEYLDWEKSGPSGAAVADRDLEQRQDRARAQAGYRAADARVAALVERYGETAVLDWLRRGLPAEVRNSNISRPNTNSR